MCPETKHPVFAAVPYSTDVVLTSLIYNEKLSHAFVIRKKQDGHIMA